MKTLSSLFTFLLLLCTGSSYAYLHPCPGQWGVEAEFLYLLTSIDDTYFVIDSPTSSTAPAGKRKNNDFGFQPGFRVGGVYAFCDCDREFRASYTRLRSTTREEVFGNFLWATVGAGAFTAEFENYTGTATSDNDLLYQRVDGFFTQKVWDCCNLDLYLYGGFEYAYIRVREDLEYRRTVVVEELPLGEVNQKSKVWGIGPQFGLEFDYDICSISWCYPGTLSLRGQTTGSILVSKTLAKASNDTTAGSALDVDDNRTWRIVPAWHARLGLNYATCFSCFGASLEIGYEFNTYIRAVNWQAFPDVTANGLCYTAYKNFDAHGLYVNVGVTF